MKGVEKNDYIITVKDEKSVYQSSPCPFLLHLMNTKT